MMAMVRPNERTESLSSNAAVKINVTDIVNKFYKWFDRKYLLNISSVNDAKSSSQQKVFKISFWISQSDPSFKRVR